MTVVVADDDPTFRWLVATVLADHDDIVLVGQADDGFQALAQCLELVPDVVLLDLNMPGGGVEGIQSIHEELPTTKIVILTGSADSDDIFSALKAGASGYLLKDGFVEDLADVIRAMSQGVGVFFSPAIAARVLGEFGYSPPP
jgi:two-component system NarL family response regulator